MTSGSKLQGELAVRILQLLEERGAGPGYHLVELDLCKEFNVSRTPIRGALKLLEAQGKLERRANRGYVLLKSVKNAPSVEAVDKVKEEDGRLTLAIAKARNTGVLPDECSQLEIARLLDANVPKVVRVLRQLADLGLVERKPGNGWSFASSIDSRKARTESYAFRAIIEPACLTSPTFEMDENWLQQSREAHLAFRKRKWRDSMAMEFFAVNSEFHEQLARCSGNRYLLDAVQRQNRLRSFLNIQWVNGPERVTASIDEHLEILDLVASGERKIAARLMRDHLAAARDVMSTIA